MNRKSTKEVLVESFRELAEVKSVDRITIQDITTNCGYSISTFYRYFRDKYELIAWAYVNSLQKAVLCIPNLQNNWQRVILSALEICQNNKKKILNLIQNTHGYDSFFMILININSEELKKYIQRNVKEITIEGDLELCIRAYCSGMVFLLCEWLQNKFTISSEQLVKIFIKALPEEIKQLLQE